MTRDRNVARKIAPGEYRRRRSNLMGMMTPDTIAIIPGAKTRTRNRDVDYVFRQDSDFWYLTGFNEPESILVLAPGREHGETILFCEERDERHELYNGERLGPDRVSQVLGVDDGFPISDIAEILPGFIEGCQTIYVTLGDHPEFDRRLLGWVADIRAREAGGAIPPGEFVALKHLLHEQRLVKSAAEVRLMRAAASITAEAHVRAMQTCRPGMNETALEAELTYTFMRRGARSSAYPSIVGGGVNACVLHYIDNDADLKDGDLVLIDAGCEYQHYAADLTRTFPVSGKFTKAQTAIYEIVLEAQKLGIEACRVGAAFNVPHDAALAAMVEGLVDLELLDGDVGAILEEESYRDFCPHKTSHWLGIDVHDVGDYRVDGTWRTLEPGMVLTIEPGIYMPAVERLQHVPARWRGLGIRIEDDVLITKDGPEVLTASVPKEISDIEALMGPRRG